MIVVKKWLSILIISCVFISATAYAATCYHDHGDDGGNRGCHSTGSVCNHGRGSGYWDYTCEHTTGNSRNGYHSRNCSRSSCSKNRPSSSTQEHNGNRFLSGLWNGSE